MLGEGHAVGKLVLKGGIGGEADVLDGRERGFFGEQKQFCAAESGVACGVDESAGRFEQSDPEGGLDLHVVAECAGEVDGLEIGWAGGEDA